MKIAYCDCFSGISGDMFLGALVDAGVPIEKLQQELKKLGLPEDFHVKSRMVMKGAIAATLVEIEIEGQNADAKQTHPDKQSNDHHHGHHDETNHDHSHTHEHSHPHDDSMPHVHEHDLTEHVGLPQSEEQDHPHGHSHSGRPVHPRNFAQIRGLIESSALSQTVKSGSLAIFEKLAAAEGKIHAMPPDEVHFHEVGAVDSILDIVGAIIGLEVLGIERLYASALPLGSGQIRSQHGTLPLPAPATLELMRMANMPVVPSPAQKELVTPTGAAILATLATFEQPAMRLTGTGTGAGGRDLPWPNILRLLVGEAGGSGSQGELVLMETNIDDMSGQGFGQVMGKLFAAGALDVFFAPIFMKKNRPATQLSVIAPRLHEAELARILLTETTTFGMRLQSIGRFEAQREMRKVNTAYGEIDMKLKWLDGQIIQAIPEYETCLRVAEETHLPFIQIYQAAYAAGLAWVGQPDEIEPT